MAALCPSWVTATFEFEDPGWLYTLLDHGHDHDHNSLTNTTIMTTIMTMTMKRNYDVITVSHSFSVLNKNMSSLDMTMIMARPNGQTKTNVDHTCDCLCVCHKTPQKLWSYLWTAPNDSGRVKKIRIHDVGGIICWEIGLKRFTRKPKVPNFF